MERRATTAVDEQVAAALLPTLLHRINNTTQTLVAVRALLDGGDMPPRCSEDLAAASRAAHEEGWLLGVIAGGLGADLLLARHESDCLAPLMKLAREAVRRAGKELEYDEASVPRLRAPRGPDAPAAWRVCWSIAKLIWLAGSRAEAGSRMNVRFDHADGACVLRGDRGADREWLAFAGASCTELGHGARCEHDGSEWSFTLPRASTEPARDL